MTIRKPVLENHRGGLAAILVASTAVACAATEPARAPARATGAAGNAVYTAPRRKADGGEAQVNLLARAFLAPASEAQTGFAYYAYLVFTDSSPASAPARRATSAAYLEMLTHVAREKQGAARADMAVLFVPLADKAAAGGLLKERDPQSLLAAYDYPRARGMAGALKRAGKAVPGVAIVGSSRPLAANATPAADAIDVVDLSDPGTARERLERFRDSLETGERHLSEGGQPVVLKRLREFFAWADAASSGGPTTLSF